MNPEEIFLVIVNQQYYPLRGSGDWTGMFATKQLADEFLTNLELDVFEHAQIVAIDIANLTWRTA